MFKLSFPSSKSKTGANKISKRSFKKDDTRRRLREKLATKPITPDTSPSIGAGSPMLNSAIVTVAVGKEQRLFGAHEELLRKSPWFREALKGQFFTSQKQLTLHDEEPEVFSAILQYLYKGDYDPRLIHDRKRNTWSLEKGEEDLTKTPRSDRSKHTFVGFNELAVIYHHGVDGYILRDTAVYCAALRYSLPDLQRLALQKQGLQSGIDVATIIRSARFAYANTPDSESKLRPQLLALVARSRKTFKKSGTMQMEMMKGGTQFFFDLFVTLSNHLDDLEELLGHHGRSPRTGKF